MSLQRWTVYRKTERGLVPLGEYRHASPWIGDVIQGAQALYGDHLELRLERGESRHG